MKSEGQGRHGSSDEMADDASRLEQQGEPDEPNAPTSGEENSGLSTILDAGPMTGVQDNASEE